MDGDVKAIWCASRGALRQVEARRFLLRVVAREHRVVKGLAIVAGGSALLGAGICGLVLGSSSGWDAIGAGIGGLLLLLLAAGCLWAIPFTLGFAHLMVGERRTGWGWLAVAFGLVFVLFVFTGFQMPSGSAWLPFLVPLGVVGGAGAILGAMQAAQWRKPD